MEYASTVNKGKATMIVLLLIVGLILLVGGAELLVRAASQLASSLGIAPLIVGLTVVAFGTSAPELAVSIYSSLSGQPEIAIGNVVGSNIMNVLFILGLASVICPLVVSKQLIRLDVPIMIATSMLVFVLAWDGVVSRWEGGILFAGLIGYTLLLFRLAKRGTPEAAALQARKDPTNNQAFRKSTMFHLGGIIIGLGILVLGSNLFVSNAITLARAWGVSESVIGATIIAGGTSLPELVTCIIAAVKGHRDLAVGNVVGSNIFNLLGVLGLSAAVAPDGLTVLPAVFGFDFPVMLVAAIVCLPIFFTGGEISRWEGLLFFAYYIAYAVLLVFGTTEGDLSSPLKLAMLYFVIPLTIVTIAVSVIHAVRKLDR